MNGQQCETCGEEDHRGARQPLGGHDAETALDHVASPAGADGALFGCPDDISRQPPRQDRVDERGLPAPLGGRAPSQFDAMPPGNQPPPLGLHQHTDGTQDQGSDDSRPGEDANSRDKGARAEEQDHPSEDSRGDGDLQQGQEQCPAVHGAWPIILAAGRGARGGAPPRAACPRPIAPSARPTRNPRRPPCPARLR